jgi:molecular chaperone HscB
MTETRPQPALQQVNDGHSLCWHCKSKVRDEPQCPTCVKIQPLGRDSDYFTVMGLPRKLAIDPRVLEPVYHALSRRFHPDRYRSATGRERIIALENSALLNQAYRTLRDPFDRAAYLLQLEEGRGAEAKAEAPQDLFEEILAVQELLGEYKFADPEEQETLRPELVKTRDHLQAEQDRRAERLTGEVFTRWDALHEPGQSPAAEQKAPLLTEIRRLIGERAYLRRVLTSLNDALK